jgi:hypothetical protein
VACPVIQHQALHQAGVLVQLVPHVHDLYLHRQPQQPLSSRHTAQLQATPGHGLPVIYCFAVMLHMLGVGNARCHCCQQRSHGPNSTQHCSTDRSHDTAACR